MNLQFYIIFIIYAISTNLISTQDFFKAQLSPSAFTFVPYLDGEVTVYEHIQNGSRLFVPPLAVLYLNQTRVFYNRLSGKYLLRLSLILYTNELRTTILKYVSHTRNRCSPPQEICDIKMVPTERLRVVWKRTNKMSSDYNLDTSWQSNTALLNKIDVHIECTTNQTCDDLLNDVLETPDILNGLELEYSTQTEKQARKIVTITGQHVMKTQMYSQLKQLPSSTTESSVRYLLVDDMNQLLTEILTTMELEEITDSGYITQDDQKTLTDLLRQRLSLNVEILHGHMERQWNSVYWNSDNIRPDRIVNLLNDELEHLRNKTILTHQNQTSVEQQQHQKQIDEGSAHASYDTSENLSNSNRNKTDRLNDRAGSNSTGQKLIDQNSRDQSHGHSYQDSSSNSRYRDRSSSSSTDAKATFAGFGAGVSLSKSNSHIDGDSSSRSHYGSNDWRNAMSKYSDRSQEGSNAWKDTQGTGDDLSGYNATAWRHAANQNQQTAHDHSSTEEDAQSFQELRHQNFDFYKNNRQFIEFTGEKFIVKPVKAYKLNLATFQENTKFVHRSIVVSHIDLIHAVPIRILSLSSNALLAPVPVIDNYTNVFELKLRELNEELTVTKLALANVKLSLSTIENNTEKSKLHTTIHLTELKSSVTTNKNNVDELKLHTTSQLTELKSLLTAVEHNVDELKLHTTSQLTELKSSATAADNKLSALLTTQAEKDKVLTLFTGEIRLYTSSTTDLPANWLRCDGSKISRVTYSRLFAVIGTTYDVDNTDTATFQLPDLQGRVVIGRDLSKIRTDYAIKIGDAGGHAKHTLTTDELPLHYHASGSLMTDMEGSHTHSIYDPGHKHDAKILEDYGSDSSEYFHVSTSNGKSGWYTSRIDVTSSTTNIILHRAGDHRHAVYGYTNVTGNGHPFSLLNPYLTLDYIIYAD